MKKKDDEPKFRATRRFNDVRPPPKGTWGPPPGLTPLKPASFFVPGFQDAAGEFKRHRVFIFGAGIGGLTAAQELAERGFKVIVVEKRGESAAGGLATSQWHISPRIETIFNQLYTSGGPPAPPPGPPVRPQGFWLPAEHGFRFFPSFYCHVIDTMKRIPIWDRLDLQQAFVALSDLVGYPELQCDLNVLNASAASINTTVGGPIPAPTVNTNQQLFDAVQVLNDVAIFRGQSDFFRPPFVVADNLVATNKTGLVFDDGRGFVYDRRLPRSGMGAYATTLLELFGLGHDLRDLGLRGARMLQFLTSCRERRLAVYEKMSFWEYMEADRMSPALQSQLGRFIRLLVAMDAKRADARTTLNVMVRMLLDQGTEGQKTDRVLNGPTSERWIVPWVKHLKQRLDVDFHWCTTLERFVLDAKGRVVDAIVTDDSGISVAVSTFPSGVPHQTDSDVVHECNYFVTDLPIHGLWNVLQASPGLLAADELETLGQLPRCFPRDNPDPPLLALGQLLGDDANPWMSGIQFYLSDPIDMGVPGHVTFMDSKWGLTAIVQSQFWGPDFVSRYGNYVARAVLSVDLTEFDEPGETVPMTLKQLATAALAAEQAKNWAGVEAISDQIAVEVWHQMAKGLQQWEVHIPAPESVTVAGVTFPVPFPYLDHHIDWGLCGCNQACRTFKMTGPKGTECVIPFQRRDTPRYFITPPDSWRKRPGPLPSYEDNERGYRVRLGSAPTDSHPTGLLVAGVYAQTFTSLNTMEAANESARHAVNGLLAHNEAWREAHKVKGKGNRFEKCAIWPLEELEPADFESEKQIDSRLFALGDPHRFEIQGIDEFVEYILRVCNVENQPSRPEELQDRFREVLWTLTAFGRFDPF